jgi:hypothetical protein
MIASAWKQLNGDHNNANVVIRCMQRLYNHIEMERWPRIHHLQNLKLFVLDPTNLYD